MDVASKSDYDATYLELFSTFAAKPMLEITIMPVFLMSTMVFLTLQGSCIDPMKCLASTSELATTGTVVSDHFGMGRISYYFRVLFQKGPCLNIL